MTQLLKLFRSFLWQFLAIQVWHNCEQTTSSSREHVGKVWVMCILVFRLVIKALRFHQPNTTYYPPVLTNNQNKTRSNNAFELVSSIFMRFGCLLDCPCCNQLYSTLVYDDVGLHVKPRKVPDLCCFKDSTSSLILFVPWLFPVTLEQRFWASTSE